MQNSKNWTKILEVCWSMIGSGPGGLVSVEDYEEAMARSRQLKEHGFAKAEGTEEELA